MLETILLSSNLLTCGVHLMLHNSHVIVDRCLLSYDKFMFKSAILVLQGAPMSWDARLKILSDVITDLCKRGEKVPQSIINDLRSARVMLEVVKADRARAENIARLEEYLSNVESYALSAARSILGEEYVNDVLRKLCELEVGGFTFEGPVRFRPGLPREERWIRIQVSEITPLELIREISGELNLEIRVEEDGYVLVRGTEENLKAFIKRIAERTRVSRGKVSFA